MFSGKNEDGETWVNQITGAREICFKISAIKQREITKWNMIQPRVGFLTIKSRCYTQLGLNVNTWVIGEWDFWFGESFRLTSLLRGDEEEIKPLRNPNTERLDSFSSGNKTLQFQTESRRRCVNRFCLKWKQSAEIEAREDVYLFSNDDDSWAMIYLMLWRLFRIYFVQLFYF